MKTAFKQKDGSVKWVNYQDLPNIKGERKIEDRIKYFNKNDFGGASVLDIGCWGGQMMLQAKEWGAKKVFGVEIDRDAIRLGRGLGLDIIRDDIENPIFWREIENFDVILLLAILGNMRNKEAVLSRASQKAKILYVEGHGKQHKFSVADWIDLFLTYTTYKNIEYLGDIQGRPFFRLTNTPFNTKNLTEANFKRLALIGKPGAGKTYTLKYFNQPPNNGYKVYSDVEKIGGEEKVIVDSHGALTLTNYDCVINIISDKRFKRIELRAGANLDDFADTISPLYKKGFYNFYTIRND